MDAWNQTMLGALLFSTVLRAFGKILHATTKILGTIQTDSRSIKEKNMDRDEAGRLK